MENLIVKENGFIYKGEFYNLVDSDLSIGTKTYLVDTNTNKEYSYCSDLEILPEDGLFALKTKYTVEKGWSSVEVFDTKEEAEQFILEITKMIK